MSPAARMRIALTGSHSIVTPTTKAPTEPMPVQTVYAVPSGIVRMAAASSQKLPTIVTRVMTDGIGRVKPCDSSVSYTHLTLPTKRIV